MVNTSKDKLKSYSDEFYYEEIYSHNFLQWVLYYIGPLTTPSLLIHRALKVNFHAATFKRDDMVIDSRRAV